MNKKKKCINYKAFIVLETFPYPFILVDREGNPKIHKTKETASFNCFQCQKGIVIDLVKMIIVK
jgi:hypothetical protein